MLTQHFLKKFQDFFQKQLFYSVRFYKFEIQLAAVSFQIIILFILSMGNCSNQKGAVYYSAKPQPQQRFHSQRLDQDNFKRATQLCDEEIQALLSARLFKAPEFYCGSNNKIERFCSNGQCKFDAMCCDKEDCKHCELLHEHCLMQGLKRLNKKVEEKFFIHRKIIRNLFTVENELINKLITNRRTIMQELSTWRFGGLSSSLIESIYFQNTTKGLKGNQMKILFNQLSEKLNDYFESQQYIKSYKKEGEEIIRQLESARKNIIKNVGDGGKSIILNADKNGLQKYFFLLKQLNYPSSLKLLFRASQHNFAVSKFHECCDGISDTVTIVRTEFGKTIAAYTPLKWSSVNGFVADDSSRSFLLQLELKQRMALTEPQSAIRNYKDYGPRFGGGADLWIADKSNQNQNSGSNFPYSYNCNGKYKNSQESYTAFCGSPNGSNFRIAEWQVFGVVR